MSNSLEIDADFPGGNIVVECIHGDEVRLHQELRDTGIDWFYWCFRVRGGAGRTLRFTFTKKNVLGVRGPAISLDAGTTWRWLGAECVEGDSFTAMIPEHVPEVRFSFAMPYQAAHWRRFMAEVGARSSVVPGTLCTTPKGRAVEYAVLRSEKTPRHRVVITCRHHCCEMMVNYSLEGLIRWLLQNSEAQWLRMNVEFLLLPFMDTDGVEEGDQGKGRLPRDHGRDYAGESLHASTRALREWLPAWGDGRLHLGLDLHCPWISGPHNEVLYLVGSHLPAIETEQRRFTQMLADVATGPLPISAEDFLPYGEAWNTGQNFSNGKGFGRWVAELPGIILGSSLEIPYANARGGEVNAETAGLFGADLGRAISRYLQTLRS